MAEQMGIKAKAVVKLSKYDDKGNLIEETTTELTEEEVQNLWLSQQKA